MWPDLTFVGKLDPRAALAATRLLAGLVAWPELTARWDDESACAGLSVGGLTWHLINQPQRLVEVLESHDPRDSRLSEPIAVSTHYARAVWLHEDLEGPSNVGVRERGEQQAAAGPQAAALTAQMSLARLDAALTAVPPVVVLPWTGAAMAIEDVVATRLLEIVVHSDDLAASLDVPVPQFPHEVLSPVLTLLTDLAVRRHGQDALVRSLSRPQRAPASISAF
ncbi:maleylpyruvate isomerase N-terminal domain-containing protein [Cellulomonas sp. DKR-3]|uniref:Maleylpyruvate isomerase N-terminal domain-containing protein n=1 Tax=Cellulomonas fulva TaxID=2835530 RepID=A0ABS5U0J9_9CELL|nr:maleylpyruvate isomerase N-terminal domain-containing protein [Cellulomonas fulva]MBT0994924.1 maleylpyruvate isomerase N-terminal domain-containing protein [Cellulomonas fulva]